MSCCKSHWFLISKNHFLQIPITIQHFIRITLRKIRRKVLPNIMETLILIMTGVNLTSLIKQPTWVTVSYTIYCSVRYNV